MTDCSALTTASVWSLSFSRTKIVLAWFSVPVIACAFCQRQEDNAAVEDAGLGGVDAPDGKELLADIAIGGVDGQVDLVAHAQSHFLGQRLADQDTFAVIGGEKLALDQALPVWIVGYRIRVDADDPDAGGLVPEVDESRWQTAGARRLSPARARRVGRPPGRVFNQVFPFQAGFALVIGLRADLQMAALQPDGGIHARPSSRR